jgi:hypothetical protein
LLILKTNQILIYLCENFQIESDLTSDSNQIKSDLILFDLNSDQIRTLPYPTMYR